MEILGKLLGSPARVKIMRLFLLNRSKGFTNVEVVNRSRVTADIVRRELKLLESIDFIKRRTKDWIINPVFKYASETEKLLISSDSLDKEGIIQYFKKAFF